MKSVLRFSLVLALAAACLLQSGILAGDKEAKESEKKKKPEPAKDIVVDGELINADLKDKVQQQSFAKSYTFKMEKDRTYQIELSSRSFQTCLRLEDASGNTIATAIDPFGNQRAMILHQAKQTEDCQIIATTTQAGITGKFTLVIKDASLYTVLNVNDKINQNDKGYANAGNKKHKMFLVELEAGKTYQIDMKSKSFDSYLYFESPGGKLLTQDDDSGGYPDARIIWKAGESGKFRVVCTHFGAAFGAGDFTLTVRQTEGGVPALAPKDGAKDK